MGSNGIQTFGPSFETIWGLTMANKPKSFETERLVIMPTSIHDAKFIHRLMNTPKWIKFIGDRNVHSVSKAKEYIEDKMIPQQKKLGFSNYTIVKKNGGDKIGTCGLFDRAGLDGLDIGFALLPEFEGKGFAFEATKRIFDAAFHEFGITKLSAITTKDNRGSQKLLEKLGLRNKGTTMLPHTTEELLLYEIKK